MNQFSILRSRACAGLRLLVFLTPAFFPLHDNPCTAAEPDTVDLAVTNIVYDLPTNQTIQGSRRMFAVDIRVDALTGPVLNNVYLFRVNLYWARGVTLADRIGLAATERFQWNHQNHPVGNSVRLVLPTTFEFSPSSPRRTSLPA